MNYQVKIADKKVNFILKNRKNSRGLRLARYNDGSLVITKPSNFSLADLNKFIQGNTDRLLRWINKFANIKTQPWQTYSRQDYLGNRTRAKVFLEQRLKHWNQFYNFSFNRISVRNSRSRWGSCSSKKNLNFNYKIIFLPEAISDYIIVHELCHLAEFNHSQKFWQLVQKTQPNYRELRKKLRNKLF